MSFLTDRRTEMMSNLRHDSHVFVKQQRCRDVCGTEESKPFIFAHQLCSFSLFEYWQKDWNQEVPFYPFDSVSDSKPQKFKLSFRTGTSLSLKTISDVYLKKTMFEVLQHHFGTRQQFKSLLCFSENMQDSLGLTFYIFLLKDSLSEFIFTFHYLFFNLAADGDFPLPLCKIIKMLLLSSSDQCFFVQTANPRKKKEF